MVGRGQGDGDTGRHQMVEGDGSGPDGFPVCMNCGRGHMVGGIINTGGGVLSGY